MPTDTRTAPEETVSPEELTALVARLHETHDALTVSEIATALGVAPDEVAAALHSVRQSHSEEPIPLARRKPRLKTILAAIGVAIIVVGGTVALSPHQPASISSTSFGTPRAVEYKRYYREDNPLQSTRTDPGPELRRLLPQGMTLRVGEMSYTGLAPIGNEPPTETDLLPLIAALELNHRNWSRGSKWKAATIRAELVSESPKDVSGLSFTALSLSDPTKAGPPSEWHIPNVNPGMHSIDNGLRSDTIEVAENRLEAIANRIVEANAVLRNSVP